MLYYACCHGNKEIKVVTVRIMANNILHGSVHGIIMLYCCLQCIVNDTNYGPLAENLKQYPSTKIMFCLSLM